MSLESGILYLCRIVFIVFVSLWLMAGCNCQETKSDTRNFLAKAYAQDELDNILKVGMSPQDVVNILGEPFSKDKTLFVYRLNFDEKNLKENEFIITGFSVVFRNNKVIRWEPSYTLYEKIKY